VIEALLPLDWPCSSPKSVDVDVSLLAENQAPPCLSPADLLFARRSAREGQYARVAAVTE
jgi:hypothetical protein